MGLHISLEQINDVGKTKIIKNLKEFLTKKSYKTKMLTDLQNESIKYILNNFNLTFSEKAMLNAVDRSLTWNNEKFEEYDVILWNKSILNDYLNNTDKYVKSSFIRNINRFFPDLDLYIVLGGGSSLQKLGNLLKKQDNVYLIEYDSNNEDKVLENIVRLIFNVLPRCKWCGRLFTKTTHNKKYCSDNCKSYAKEEQNRDNFRNYYKKYRDVLSESEKGALGSKGANLHGSANPDSKVELKLINNEKKRLRLV